MDCGGAYIKILPGGDKIDVLLFGGNKPYAIMFGPDMCGSKKKNHVILNLEKKDENDMIEKDIMCETDQLSHLYTLVLSPEYMFKFFVNKKSVRAGFS